MDFGLRFRKIIHGENFFNVCCILHNMMLDQMERITSYRVPRGIVNAVGGIWIEGRTFRDFSRDGTLSNKVLAKEWKNRRDILAEHLHYSARLRARNRV